MIEDKINDIKQNLATDILNLEGLSVDERIREIKSFSVLKKEIDLVVLMTVQNLYCIIKDHPVAMAYLVHNKTKTDFENLNEIYDYASGLLNFSKNANQTVKEKMLSGEIVHPNIAIYRHSGIEFSNFMKIFSEFVAKGINVSALNQDKDGEIYLKRVSQCLNSMNILLKQLRNYLGSWQCYGDYLKIFDSTKTFFSDCVVVVDEYIARYKEDLKKEKQLNESTKTDASMIVKPVPNEKEQVRLNMIKEANELYNRFVVDFMRDLQKEVSIMNRDMYDALISKVEKFLKKFPMPLSNDVSVGMANEAYSQISKFIDAVYEISRNTYTPVVFGN